MIRIHHALALAALLAAPLVASPAAIAAPAMEASAGGKTILVDDNGMALYTFDKDQGGKSACNGKCAENWPPLAAEDDAKAEGPWTIVERDDGTKMWAYDGKPLYTFVNDTEKGQVNGDGINGVWHVATPQ